MSSSVTQTEISRSAATQAKKKIAMLGCGKMGTILLESFLERKLIAPEEAVATVQHGDRSQELSRALRESLGAAIRERRKGLGLTLALVIFPSIADRVAFVPVSPLIFIALLLKELFVGYSIAHYRVRNATADDPNKDVPVVRAMPNTPAMVGAAMTAISPGPAAKPEHLETAKHLFESIGRALVVDEKHMDAITALSASGPAFVFVILESLAEAGVKVGLPREMATTLAAQTLFGSALLALETGHHPALLKDAVTTPAGCTIEGLMELEKGGLRVTLMNAVIKTTIRARELMTS